MTPIINLSEDDRSLIMWDVREWCDTFSAHNPDRFSRRELIGMCFIRLRGLIVAWGLQSALRFLEDDRNRIPEIAEREQAEEAAYWHRAPRSWE